MSKKKRKPSASHAHAEELQDDVELRGDDGQEEHVNQIQEWRRLRGLKNRLAAALATLNRESKNGPIAFEHFLTKCRSIAGFEE